MRTLLHSRLTWLCLIGSSLILWPWVSSIQKESSVILTGQRCYSIGHNDSEVFLGWWEDGKPFTGSRKFMFHLNGTRDSSGPLFPGFRMADHLGFFDRVVFVPYWSVLLAWTAIWLGTGLYLRRIRKQTSQVIEPCA